MSDRAPLQVHIPAGLPTEVHTRIVDVLGEFGFDIYVDPAEQQTKFLNDEVVLGSEDDAHEMLQQVIADTGVDFAYRIWQDPKYDFNGALIWHTPGLEDFTSDATAVGDVIVDATLLVAAARDSGNNGEDIRALVLNVTGAAHMDRLVYPQPS